ncbi:hypothetical protein [Salinibacillus aidingensis]
MGMSEPEVHLDKYIMMPALNFTDEAVKELLQDPSNELFVRATLFSRVNSLLITENSPLETKKLLDKISTNTEFYDYEIIGADGVTMDVLVNMTEANLYLIIILIFLLFFVTLCTLIYVLKLKVRKNIDTYTVFLISGANILDITKLIRNEFILLTFVGIVIPIIPFSFLTGGSFPLLLLYSFVCLIVGFTITFMGSMYMNKIFKNIDIVQQLKRW